MNHQDDHAHDDTGKNRRARILVIDDDPSTRLMAREVLEPSEFEVKVVSGGPEGLKEFEPFRPDIVLLDILMPEFDGFTTLERLRKLDHGEDCPVVMITGLHDSVSVEQAYECGATDFITKPINWELLRHRLRYMLRAMRRENQRHGPSADPGNGAADEITARILDAVQRIADGGGDSRYGADIDTIRSAAQQLIQGAPIVDDGAINRERIDQLKSFRRADGSSLLERVVDLFERESRDLLDRLETAIEECRAEEVRSAAHKLKSVSGNVGADELHAQCGELEKIGLENRLDSAGEMLQAIRVECARASRALERELEDRADS